MSYASDFGHDIPPDDWDGGGYRRKRYYSNRFTGDNPLFKILNKKFIKLVYETEKAYLLEFAQGKTWLPKSQTSLDREGLVVYLPFWFYNKISYIKE